MSAAEIADPLLVETVERLLVATCTFDEVEHGELTRWSATVWDALAEAGFPWVGVPEAAGGMGGSLADAASIVRAVGTHAAPVPLAETGLLGGWLLAAAQQPIPDGPVTVVPDPSPPSLAPGRVVGSAVVAWAQSAKQIAALIADGRAWRVAVARPDQVSITPGANLAGEPRDTVNWDVPVGELVLVDAPAGVDGEALVARGSLTRILLAAGAMEAMAQLAVDYTAVRRQFGKPVASFQAVQQHLVASAQCSVKVSMAADLALRAAMRGDAGIALAAARVVVDDATVIATRAVHQAHGAMGVTREYPLHHLSRRLWSWRHEYLTGASWKRQLGAQVSAAGADDLFPLLTR